MSAPPKTFVAVCADQHLTTGMPSGDEARLPAMTEAHWSEIEKVLLYIADARARAAKAHTRLEREEAPASVREALAAVERDLGDIHRQLKQRTYFSVADAPLTLGV